MLTFYTEQIKHIRSIFRLCLLNYAKCNIGSLSIISFLLEFLFHPVYVMKSRNLYLLLRTEVRFKNSAVNETNPFVDTTCNMFSSHSLKIKCFNVGMYLMFVVVWCWGMSMTTRSLFELKGACVVFVAATTLTSKMIAISFLDSREMIITVAGAAVCDFSRLLLMSQLQSFSWWI